MSKSRNTQPTAPTRQIKLVSQADLCRISTAPKSTTNKAVHGPLAPAMLPGGNVDSNHPLVVHFIANHAPPHSFTVYPDTFAAMAGCSVGEVKKALERGGQLLPAMTLDRKIQVTHSAALEFLSAHPFELDAKWAPTNVPSILQTTAREDREWTDAHPLSQAYGAREDAATDLRNSKASN